MIGLQIRNSKDDLIIVGKRAVGRDVFAVYGRWWHRRELGEPGYLRTKLRPQLPDAGSFGHLPLLLIPASSLAKRRKIKQMDAHEEKSPTVDC